jgi:hypothetical protein
MISEQLIDELGLILKEEYALELNSEKVKELAIILLNFFEILNKIAKKEVATYGK